MDLCVPAFVSLCDDQSETPRRSGTVTVITCFMYPETLPTLCPSLAVWGYFGLYLIAVVPLQLYPLRFYSCFGYPLIFFSSLHFFPAVWSG